MHYLIFLPLILCLFTGCRRGPPCCDYEEVVDQTYVHKYGVEVPAEDWDYRGQSGKVVTTLKNGVIVTQNYSSGALDGETTYTYPHSDIIEKTESYSNDALHKEMSYYRSGAPMQQKQHDPHSDSKSIVEWYENGNPRSNEEHNGYLLVKGEYYTPSHQTESKVVDGNGLKTRRDAYGNLQAVDTYQNGELILTTTYYPNGSPKTMTPYNHQVIDGLVKEYLPGGEPKSIEEWSRGSKTGITTLFENGEKFAEIPYVNGLKDGVERRFRNHNMLVEEITWVKDEKHGPNTTYLGGTAKSDWYFKGKPVTQTAFERMSAVRTY